MTEQQLARLDRKVDALLLGMGVLIRHLNQENQNMSKIHDDLMAAAAALDASADSVIASKGEDESQVADVLARMQATQAKLDAAVAGSATVEEPAAAAVLGTSAEVHDHNATL